MRGTPVRRVDFSGGVNYDDSAYLVAENEATDALNVISDDRGAIQKRWGCQTFGPADDYDSLNAWRHTAASPTFVAVNHTGQVKAIPTGAAVATDISPGGLALPTSIVDMTNAPAQPTVAGQPGIEKVYMVGKGFTPKMWDGTLANKFIDWALYAPKAVGTGGYSPILDGDIYDPGATYRTAWTNLAPEFITTHSNRVWLADPLKCLVMFSEPMRPDIFPEENTIEFDAGEGDPITGIGTCGPYVIVFKSRRTYIIYDTDTGANRPLSRNIGCVARRSIVDTPDGTYWLTWDQGVWRTDGSGIKKISTGIDAILRGLPVNDRPLVCGGYTARRYYLSLPSRERVYDYNAEQDSWFVHDLRAEQFLRVSDPLTSDMALCCASKTPTLGLVRCFVVGITQDYDAPMSWRWVGPWWSFKTPFIRKRCRQIHLDGRGTVDVGIARDFVDGAEMLGTNVFPYGSSTFGGDGVYGGDGIFGDIPTQSEVELYSLGTARAFQVHLSATSSTFDEVDAITMNIQNRKD